MDKNIVFLDFDGVMIPIPTPKDENFKLYNEAADNFFHKSGDAHPLIDFTSPNAVKELNALCVETNASIIVHSAWRLFEDASSIYNIIKRMGEIGGCAIEKHLLLDDYVSFVANISYYSKDDFHCRYKAIKDMAKVNNIRKFVVFDDLPFNNQRMSICDMNPCNWIVTHESTGLTSVEADVARHRFYNPNTFDIWQGAPE